MEKIAVFVNDASHAMHLLKPMLQAAEPTHWILVAQAPKLTRHIGRWVSGSAREQWKERWGAELFAALEPVLRAAPGSRIEKMLARRPLVQVSERLQARLGPVRFLDARRPRIGRDDGPITADQPTDAVSPFAGGVAVASSLSAVLALAD
jgi:hypothetical protein